MVIISPEITDNMETRLWKNVLIGFVQMLIRWLSSLPFMWIILMRNYLIIFPSCYIQFGMIGVKDNGTEGGDLRLCGRITIGVKILCEVLRRVWREEMLWLIVSQRWTSACHLS